MFLLALVFITGMMVMVVGGGIGLNWIEDAVAAYTGNEWVGTGVAMGIAILVAATGFSVIANYVMRSMR